MKLINKSIYKHREMDVPFIGMVLAGCLGKHLILCEYQVSGFQVGLSHVYPKYVTVKCAKDL